MALTQSQIDEARNWITDQGYGTFGDQGLTQFNGLGTQNAGENSNSAYNIAGAAKSYFGDQGLGDNLAQILGGGYTSGGINEWLTGNAPQVNAGAQLFQAENGARATPTAPVAPAGGGGGGRNPYLDQIAGDVTRRSNEALQQGLQGIRSNAVGVGGLGGSRQGVAEGLAIKGANDSLSGNLASLYGMDYTNQQNRDLQRYGIDTNAAISNKNADYGFYTANRGLDQSGMRLGADLYNLGNSGTLGQGQAVTNLGTTQQQAPWTVINNANQNISPYTGYGLSTSGTANTGGGAMGAAGGAVAGSVIGRNMGWGTTPNNFYGNTNYSNWTGY